MSAAELKEVACGAIEGLSTQLRDLGDRIWRRPELAFEEVQAHDQLTDFLEKSGFDVRRHYELNTAFRAETGGAAGPHVAVLCEYDALPEIGHACGHNLIAEVGVATGLALKASLEASGKCLGKLTVLGTPAEEGPGGKIALIDSGAFKDVDIALMAHPGKHNIWRANTLARDKLRITFHGRCSHASISPWDGLNALDAAVLFHQNVACLRQQMKPSWKVHGVICQGGVASNIIPELTELDYRVRAPNVAELETLTKRVIDCCHGAALATGCKVEYEFLPSRYLEMLSNEPLIQLFEQNVGQLQLEEDSTGSFGGSTDMGNVSHVVPSIHPIFKIGTEASNHTRTFQIAAGSATAQKFTRDIAKALAMTAVDVYLNPAILRKVREEFVQDAKS